MWGLARKSSANHVLGRHAGDSVIERGTGEATPTDHFTPGTVRVCGQSIEVPVGTNTADLILRVSSQFQVNEDQSDKRKGGTDDNYVCESATCESTTETLSSCVGIGLQADREDDSHLINHLLDLTLVSRATTPSPSTHNHLTVQLC